LAAAVLEQDYFSDTAVLLDDSELIAVAVLVFYELPYGDGTPDAFGDGKSLTSY
jgi:hypothetical protein